MSPSSTVIVGNEPRCYRDAIGGFLALRRPDLRVVIVEPEEIDRTLERDHPVLVICSRLSPAIEHAPAWIVLYPEQQSRAILDLDSHRVERSDLDLDDLLTFLARAERLSATRGQAGDGPVVSPAAG